MTKRLVDIDDDALCAARMALGTTSIKETVNAALRAAAAQRQEALWTALDVLAAATIEDRDSAWR